MTTFLQDYENHKSKVARVAKGGISVAPAGVRGLTRMSHRQVMRDIHNGGRLMDEHRCLLPLKKLARLHGRVEIPVESQRMQRVEREPRKQGTCWTTCGSCDHIAAKCSSRSNAKGGRLNEVGGRFGDAGAHVRVNVSEEHGIGFWAEVVNRPVRVVADIMERAIEHMKSPSLLVSRRSFLDCRSHYVPSFRR